MPTELAETAVDDSALFRFEIPPEIRRWGARVHLADRDPLRAAAMLAVTAAAYFSFVVIGESIDRWWAWCIAWFGLVMCMMRIDAIQHEAVHRSLFVRRWLNDTVALVTGAIEGFHAPTYRCFHLMHHAVTRRDKGLPDPEGFYDEVLSRPVEVGPISIHPRVVLVAGHVIGGVWFTVQLAAQAVAAVFGRPPSYAVAPSLQRHMRRWGLAPFVLWIGGIAAAIGADHTGELLRWWIVPMLLFLCGPYTFFALPEHYAAPHNVTMLTSTGSVRSTPLYRWLTLDGNLHLAHHVFPTASYWRLSDADAQLRNLSTLRYRGYVAFHRAVWRDLTTTTPPEVLPDGTTPAP